MQKECWWKVFAPVCVGECFNDKPVILLLLFVFLFYFFYFFLFFYLGKVDRAMLLRTSPIQYRWGIVLGLTGCDGIHSFGRLSIEILLEDDPNFGFFFFYPVERENWKIVVFFRMTWGGRNLRKTHSTECNVILGSPTLGISSISFLFLTLTLPLSLGFSSFIPL